MGCVKRCLCSESEVFQRGSWSALVSSTAVWGSWDGDRQGGRSSRGKTRQYCARALKEPALTCRNHTAPWGCLAVSLPLCSTQDEHTTAQLCLPGAGGNVGAAQALVKPMPTLTSSPSCLCMMLPCWACSSEMHKLPAWGRAALPASPGHEKGILEGPGPPSLIPAPFQATELLGIGFVRSSG